MRKLLIVAAASLLLSGCAHFKLADVGKNACEHRVETELALDRAEVEALKIKDRGARIAAVSAIAAARESLTFCPSERTPENLLPPGT